MLELPLEQIQSVLAWTLAYVDPGTGQVILYALAAVGASILFRLRQIKDWISSKFNGTAKQEQKDE